MTHDTQNEIQKASLIGRILSMEVFLLLMGIASLLYGIVNDMIMNIFWGVVIIPGVFVLHKIRKKDWTKHRQEMEGEQRVDKERESARKSAADESRKADDAK